MRGMRIAAVALAALSSCTGLATNRVEDFRRADPGARPGGRLVVGIAAPASIDPGNVSDPSGALVSSLVCEPLVQLDPLTGELAHGIVETVTVDRTRFALKLRSGVRFHDGATLTAQDVVYSLSRVARHDYAGAQADVLRPVAGYAEIHAPLPPTETGDPADRTIAGVRAISRNALEVTLDEENAEFLRALSLPLAAPVPRELPDRDPGFADRPVCAGPYRIVRPYRHGDTAIELHRFPEYYGRNDAFAGGGAGYPDVIEFRIEPDRDAEMRDFEAGVLDVAHVPADRVREARRLGARFMEGPLPTVELLGLPTSRPPFDDPRVRGALSRALDRARLVAEVYDGGRRPADRFLPFAGLPASDACARATTGAPGGALLRGRTLRLEVNDDFRNVALARAVAAQWRRALGLDVEVEVTPWTSYLAEATSPRGFRSLFRESWAPPYPSADAVLYPLFHSRQIGRNNWARYNSRPFDRRIDRSARREEDEDVRPLKYLSLEETLCREMPLIPLTFGQEEYLVRVDRVGAAAGEFFDRWTGRPLLRELYVRSAADGRTG